MLESVARDGITEAGMRHRQGIAAGGLAGVDEPRELRQAPQHELRQIEQVTVEEVNAVARHSAEQACR